MLEHANNVVQFNDVSGQSMDGEKTPIGKQPRQVALCTNVSSQMSTAKCQQQKINREISLSMSSINNILNTNI